MLTLPETSDSLICPASHIFDGATIWNEITNAAEISAEEGDLRGVVVSILMKARKSGMAQIAEAFGKSPYAAQATTRSYTWLTDCIVATSLQVVTTYFHPEGKKSKDDRLSLLAVGGYGRGEMAPFSDVDLLFLAHTKISDRTEKVIESMLYILWDLRLKVGHASRTIRDCIKLGREDYTIRTALLEQRHLIGDASLSEELAHRLRNDLFRNTATEFIEAKLNEREVRHTKQGGQRYVVEPNIKEGKGGLRDLQSLYWIAKYVYDVRDPSDLVAKGLFTSDEYERFETAESFLWAVRCHLHLIANRAADQLTFDLQVEVAERMGYTDKTGRRAVEHFMQDFFRQATATGDLTRILLTQMEAVHAKPAPLLERFFRRKPRVKKGFEIVHNRLGIADEPAFLADKLNILRIFEEALRTGALIHPDAMRLISANLDLIDDDMRNNKDAQKRFLDLMLKHGNPERALRRMNELGVLGAFIPEFETIVAMMQFNMYHHYTVDEHTIQCIRNLSQIEHGDLQEDLPLASHILDEGVNRKVIYVALLLHDIGKGRDEDHSVLGAKISRKVAPRLGLNKAECETVEWLVRHHLLMSDMAQKRDISDPRTIKAFAKAVGNRKRLDLLTVLTVCDIRGVGPGTWNNWKAVLLRQLHSDTANALENGMEELNRKTRGTEARKNLRASLDGWDPAALRKETGRHYPPYWGGLDTKTHAVFANLLRGIPDDEVRVDLHPDENRDATRACFAMADHPGIFSRLSGALALVGANVVDARSYTTKDGYVTAVFWIQDADGSPYEESRLPRLNKTIHKTLQGEIKTSEAMQSRDKIKKRERAFRVPTSITFDNEGSDIYTIIEVDTRDRPGLLFDLTRTLAASNIYIASAVIATYGEQVVDSFYVKDMFGLKFHTESKQKTLEKRLRAAIEKGAERAVS